MPYVGRRVVRALVVVGLMTARAHAAEPDPAAADALYHQAEAAYVAGDMASARALLEQANQKRLSALYVFNIARF